MQTQRISVAEIERDKDQPRKSFDHDEMLALGQNMKVQGQLVPAILYPGDCKPYSIADGERRWRALRLVGIPDLHAIVLTAKPDALTLRTLQMSLDVHRVSLSLWERSCLLKRIRDENNWTVTELATRLQMKQPVVSKSLGYQRLDPALQHMLHTGAIDAERAFIISQEPNLERQRELAIIAIGTSRDQLRAKARRPMAAEQTKVGKATFVLPNDMRVTVHGPEVSLPGAIECLLQTARELKRSLSRNLDIVKAQSDMRLKARTKHVLAKETKPLAGPTPVPLGQAKQPDRP